MFGSSRKIILIQNEGKLEYLWIIRDLLKLIVQVSI